MAAIAQTIAIVDKSGKVVSASKQLKNVIQEAKTAYQERKAEIKAEKRVREDYELKKAIKAMSIADESRSDASRSHSRSHRQRTQDHRHSDSPSRPHAHERGYSSGSVRSGHSSPGSPASRKSPGHSPLSRNATFHAPYVEDDHGLSSAPRRPGSQADYTPGDLVRRRTDLDIAEVPRRRALRRSSTSPALDTDIDMDLAYGDFHPESISPVSPKGLALTKSNKDKDELSSLVLKCKMLLEEANCAQHSAKAVMVHLQKNPDAMAAVALTLAEISNICTKMAPGALTMLKASAPTVFGLLAAPEFLIAVGVSVGITVVCFGGYKIIKKIKAARAEGKELEAGGAGLDRKGSVDELIDVEELSRIECWRRGIADDQFADDTRSVAGSVATSVEGEFISPFAERSMGHLPLPKEGRSRREKKEKKERKEKEAKENKERKQRSSRSDAGSEKNSVSSKEKREKALVKVKKPSPLRRMFKSSESERGSSVVS